jgi:antitoxin (DNA-binding transcriptional repressor) of toxin-antitoxin stability system
VGNLTHGVGRPKLDAMTVHVPIGEAETRLAELVAAAVRGDEVILDQAGQPQVRLLPVKRAQMLTPDQIRAKRLSAFGMWKGLAPEQIDIGPSMTDDEVDERWRRKFGPPA